MKWWFYALFIIVVVLLFGLHALLFYKYHNYSMSFFLILPAIFLSAYFFLTIIIEPKESQDKKLEHLIKESLHELNLPIATIKANLEMLKRSGLEEKQLKRVFRVESALERLKRLYELLSYNLKKELMPIKKESVAIDKLIKDRVEFFKQMQRNRFILKLEPLTLVLDKIGFEQVVDNLIENAIKYSHKEGTIEIKLSNRVLKIKDNGIGIEASKLPLIYQRYYQSNDKILGQGIGLAVVKDYCDKESIGLKIDSVVGKGTEVILDFRDLIGL